MFRDTVHNGELRNLHCSKMKGVMKLNMRVSEVVTWQSSTNWRSDLETSLKLPWFHNAQPTA